MSRNPVLSIVSPERVLFDGEVQYVSVPGGFGYMGILADHAPILSSLTTGQFEVRIPGRDEPVFFSTKKDGFLEVSKNHISILLDAADSDAFPVLSKSV